MSRFSALLLVLPAALLASSAAWPAPAALPPEAAKIAKDFLFAFARNDRDTITALLPKDPAHRYGPCPFTRMPTLARPRVDQESAVVNFQGPAEPGMTGKGVFVLRWLTVDGEKRWLVRQMYWYDELPREARREQKRATEADRKQEPAVRAAVEAFVADWLAGDYPQVDRRVFHWWDRDRDPPKWVKMTTVELKPPKESLGALRVDFHAKLKILGAIPKRVNGTLWLVHEEGVWRVRPLSFAFDF